MTARNSILWALVVGLGQTALVSAAASAPSATPRRLSPAQFMTLMGAQGRKQSNPEARVGYQRIFHRLDLNGDGQLSASEYVDQGQYLNRMARQGIFRASDADGNGTVTEKEYIENRFITDEAKRIFATIDENRDNVITQSEFIQYGPVRDATPATAAFRELDRENRGEVSLIEYLRVWGRIARQANSPPPAAAKAGSAVVPGRGAGPSPERLRWLDSNGDGQIARDEFPGPPRAFDRLDENQDGVLAGPELHNLRPPGMRPGFGPPPGAFRGRPNGHPPRDRAEFMERRRNRPRGPRGSERANELEAAELKLGQPLPDVSCFTAAGTPFKLRSLKDNYAVLVLGCLT